MMWQAVLCLLAIRMISKSSRSGSQMWEWVMQKWNASDSKLWVMALLNKPHFYIFLGVVLSHFISLGNTTFWLLGTLSRMLLLTFSKQYFFLTLWITGHSSVLRYFGCGYIRYPTFIKAKDKSFVSRFQLFLLFYFRSSVFDELNRLVGSSCNGFGKCCLADYKHSLLLNSCVY